MDSVCFKGKSGQPLSDLKSLLRLWELVLTEALLSSKILGQAQFEGHTWSGRPPPGSRVYRERRFLCSLMWEVARYFWHLSFIGTRAWPDGWVVKTTRGLGVGGISYRQGTEIILRSQVGLPSLSHYILRFPFQGHIATSSGYPEGCPPGVRTREVGSHLAPHLY